MTIDADELLTLGAATLLEAADGRGWLGPGITPVWEGAAAAGPCRTVWAPVGDNLAVHVALERAQPGELLCVATDEPPDYGGWGEVLMRFARSRGVVGLVSAGGVRDVDVLRAERFAVFARGRAIRGTTKCDEGAEQVPIAIAGVPLHPGDWVVGDGDGVVVLPSGSVARIIAGARARAATEREAIAAIAAGATSRAALGIA